MSRIDFCYKGELKEQKQELKLAESKIKNNSIYWIILLSV